MKLIRKVIVGLIFFGLSYVYLSQLDKILLSSDNVVIHSKTEFKIIFSLIYGLIGFVTIILYRSISIKGLISLILITGGLFVIEGFYIKSLSNFQISANVMSEVSLNFKTIYYLPIIPFGLILLSFGLRQTKFNEALEKLPKIGLKLKPSLKRLFAFTIDWLIVLLIGWILSTQMIILWFPVEIFIVMFAYKISMEFSTNKTIGKNIFGINIRQLDDSNLKFSSVLIRNISKLTLVYWIPIIKGKTGIHDMIAKTRIE